ncbi:MAG: hypothetical protein HY756_09965 [Nitrospirae bacterium]|nr:hypothetical protein [Nitrospirota bacterium]
MRFILYVPDELLITGGIFGAIVFITMTVYKVFCKVKEFFRDLYIS